MTRTSAFAMDRMARHSLGVVVRPSCGWIGRFLATSASIRPGFGTCIEHLFLSIPSISCDVRHACIDTHLLHRVLGSGGHDPSKDGLTSNQKVVDTKRRKKKIKDTKTTHTGIQGERREGGRWSFFSAADVAEVAKHRAAYVPDDAGVRAESMDETSANNAYWVRAW